MVRFRCCCCCFCCGGYCLYERLFGVVLVFFGSLKEIPQFGSKRLYFLNNNWFGDAEVCISCGRIGFAMQQLVFHKEALVL